MLKARRAVACDFGTLFANDGVASIEVELVLKHYDGTSIRV